MDCYICGSPAQGTCSNCNRPFCSSHSGVGAGVSEADTLCKKCTLRLYDVRCTKCGNRFKSKEELEEHWQKHPVHRNRLDL